VGAARNASGLGQAGCPLTEPGWWLGVQVWRKTDERFARCIGATAVTSSEPVMQRLTRVDEQTIADLDLEDYHGD
jgi:hypothetical protein